MATVERAITCPNPECGAEISSDVLNCPVCGIDLNDAMIARATEEIKKDPKDPTNYLARGYAYGEKGDNTRAIADLDYAIILNRDYTDAYTLRGSMRLKMDDHEAAIADLNHAIKLAPGEAEPYFHRGVAYSAMKDPKRAMADFDRVLSINPTHANTYIQRSMLFDAQGKTGQAIAEIEKALQKVTDSYERTQLEDLLIKLREFRADKTKHEIRRWLSGWRLRLIIGLVVLAIGLLGNNPGFLLLAILIIGGWPVIKIFFKAIFR
jgi:tetratricopeptide (TPR) repeat protein